jgi:hypothetical protein
VLMSGHDVGGPHRDTVGLRLSPRLTTHRA